MDKARPLAASYLATTQINEVWASTKAFPAWWTDLEENRSLRRRKSVDDPVLERNICFVDTPGYGRGLSITEGIQTVISYIEEQLPRSFSAAASNRGEVVSMLSGNGGAQVDAVLYLIGKGMKQYHHTKEPVLTSYCNRGQTSGYRIPPTLVTSHQCCSPGSPGRHDRVR